MEWFVFGALIGSAFCKWVLGRSTAQVSGVFIVLCALVAPLFLLGVVK